MSTSKCDGITGVALAHELIGGALGGGMGVLVGHPFDVVKTRLQAATSAFRSLSASSCLMATVSADGVRGLWRGVVPPVAVAGVYQAVVFSSYEWSLARLRHAGINENMSLCSAGFFSGVCSCFVTTPCDIVKIKLQLQQHTSTQGALANTIACTREITRTHGPGSLFRGLTSCVVRDGPNTILYMVSYSKSKEYLARTLGSGDGWCGITSELLAGGLAGVLCWLGALPADVVKTVVQEHAANGKNLSVVAAACEIYKHDGARGFTRGAVPVVARAFPVNAITFMVYERVKDLLKLSEERYNMQFMLQTGQAYTVPRTS